MNKKNNYGKVFKEIRLGKNLTLKDVADDAISLSFLSKFERGESDISLARFMYLIDNLNIDIKEFTNLVQKYELREVDVLMSDVSKAYYNNNILKLKKIEEQELDKWNKTKKNKYKLYSIMVAAYISYLSGQKLCKERVSILTDYLFGVDDWGKLELMLYGNSIFSLRLNTVTLLSNELIGKIGLYGGVEENYKAMISTLFNTIYYCLDEEALTDARRYIEVIKNLNLSEILLFEKLELKFIIGIYEIKKDNKILGRQECEEALNVLRMLKSDNFLLQREEYLIKTLNSTI